MLTKSGKIPVCHRFLPCFIIVNSLPPKVDTQQTETSYADPVSYQFKRSPQVMEPHHYRAQIQKFSCKPARDQAARQRENQRRHRARVKGRIDDLEAELCRTQRELEEALKRIDRLTGEVQRLQHALDSTPELGPGVLRTSTPETTSPSSQLHVPPISQPKRGGQVPRIMDRSGTYHSTEGQFPSCKPTGAVTKEPAELDACRQCDTSIAHCECSSQIHHLRNSSTKPAAHLWGNGILQTAPDTANDDCPLLPPTIPGESTIPCRDAFLIIEERSTPEFDLSVATEWLKPGFRRATVPGTGCRVETHILFALVDHITSG